MAIRGVIALVIAVGLGLYFGGFLTSPVNPPEMKDGWWGRGPQKPETDRAIRVFKVKFPDAALNDLKTRLKNTRFSDDLEDTNFEYGFQTKYLKEVVDYWHKKYDWRKHEEVLNSFPQFQTNIEGIDVYFMRVRPSKTTGSKPKPLLMVHGWPGSVWEFYKIIPRLTDPAKYGGENDQAFEVICPAIPGYGFSEAPHQQGFDSADAARVFLKLMKRLGHERFYVQGGDFGSIITSIMAAAFPDNVIGMHTNMPVLPMGSGTLMLKLLIGTIAPWLVVNSEDYDKIYPLTPKIGIMLQESGYMHIQATKPDTVGTSLDDSPAGLAAYILEKFSTATNKSFTSLPDGGLTRHFTLDELLTNVMIYWVTGSMKSSQRFYKEHFGSLEAQAWDIVPVTVPASIAIFPEELALWPQNFCTVKYANIIQYTEMPRGGHFAALQEPALLAVDIQNFVRKVEVASEVKETRKG